MATALYMTPDPAEVNFIILGRTASRGGQDFRVPGVRRGLLPALHRPRNISTPEHIVLTLQARDDLFQLVIGLAPGEDPFHRSPHPDPSPRPEPHLEMEVEYRAQEPLGVLDSTVDKPASGRQRVDNTGDGGWGDEDLRDEESEYSVQVDQVL